MPFPVRSYRAAVWFRALSKSTHVDVDVSLRGDPIIGHNEYIDLVRNRQVLYSITKHAMRRSADEIGATSISFRLKVFRDATSVVDGIFSAHRVSLHDKNQPRVKQSGSMSGLTGRNGEIMTRTNASSSARGRRAKFTSQPMEKIKELVAEGLSRDEIANRLGVIVGTLQVTCSRLGIWRPSSTDNDNHSD